MKILIVVVLFFVIPISAICSQFGNIELDIGNPIIYGLGKTSDKFIWASANLQLNEYTTVGMEYSQFGDSGGYSYAGPAFLRREIENTVEQYGLRVSGYLSGTSVSSFYGAISSGLSHRKVIGSLDQTSIQHSGYAALELGYQFVFSRWFYLKISLVNVTNNYLKETDFSTSTYTEKIDSGRDGGGFRVSLVIPL